MKRIIDRLSSLSLCFYLLAALILWLAIGIFLARFPETDQVIHEMNDKLVLDWLLAPETKDWRIISWFTGFCILNLLFFINLALCSVTNLWNRIFLNNNKTKNTLLFAIHILIALIMLGHLTNMVIGFKKSWIKLAPGDSYALPDGYALELKAVHYTSPLKLLKMDHHEARKLMSRDRFDINANYVTVGLARNHKKIDTGRIYMLKPYKTNDFRLTLNRFFLPKKSDGASVGAILTVAVNPIHEGFFLIYALTIGCLLIYILLHKDRPRLILKSPCPEESTTAH